MGGAKNCPETPRQKMIGMMYLVLTAMLALNVSAEVLEGYTMVFTSLKNSTKNSTTRNEKYFRDIQFLYEQNPEKVGEWMDKATRVKEKSDSLVNLIQEFKIGIIANADGKEADPNGEILKKQDNTHAAGEYAQLSAGQARAKKLQTAIEDYKKFAEEMFGNDTLRNKIYEERFSTAPQYSEKNKKEVNWIDRTFNSMPAIAVVTMLSKYQNDVRNTEAEMLLHFTSAQDAGDFRVNSIQARLIPDSKNVMQGSKFHAEIALMAVDSTKKPIYYLGDNQLESQFIDIPCNQIGAFPIKGRLEIAGPDGNMVAYHFEDQYMVSAPAATVANIDMNVVYRGYDNKMEISVPGLADSQLRVSANGASITKSGNQYICKPSAKDKITILVSAEVDGKVQTIGSKEFRVRPVPSPGAFLKLPDGNRWSPNMEKAGRLKRSDLFNAELVAEYEDGMLNANFEITEFIVKIPRGAGFDELKVKGNKFSKEQLERLRGLKTKQTFLIEQIKYEMKGAKNAKSGILSMPSIPMP